MTLSTIIIGIISIVNIIQAMITNNYDSRSRIISSQRIILTEQPFIENVLDKYINNNNNDVPKDLIMLALGSVYWNPPQSALDQLCQEIHNSIKLNKYGNILGYPPLITQISKTMSSRGLSMDNMDIAITSGANQAFMNTALTICDHNDNVILIEPYYFSHKMSCQLVGANITTCPFNKATFGPDFKVLEVLIKELTPKMIIITTPNNPSGYVWSEYDISTLIQLCKQHQIWIVADQTYHEFLYDDAVHTFPCGTKYDYDRIIHIFSFSKIFGMPGWRVGYMIYPQYLTDSIRKIQDTIPTHAAMISQLLALKSLEDKYPISYSNNNNNNSNNQEECTPRNTYSEWARTTIGSLVEVREQLWNKVLAKLGTIKTYGAFYYLVPIPIHVTEDEAVDILAKRYGVLLMHGTPFGAPNHLRLSYGSIPPQQVLLAIEKLSAGFSDLQSISLERSNLNK